MKEETSNVWNDCPICGKELLFSNNDYEYDNYYIYCVTHHYKVVYVNNVHKEQIGIGDDLCIIRAENKTSLYKWIDDMWSQIFEIDKVLDFNKFYPLDKIKRLLIIS